MSKGFKITSVCRNDLIQAGIPKKTVKNITDAQMKRIAEKMADDYCEQLFWESAEYITQDIFDNW